LFQQTTQNGQNKTLSAWISNGIYEIQIFSLDSTNGIDKILQTEESSALQNHSAKETM
jgi:hypothetical protein